MLRLSFIAPDNDSLSCKFINRWDAHILDVAKDSGIRIDGLCFHVGSRATANTHADALATCLGCRKVKRKGCQRSLGSTSVGVRHVIPVNRLILNRFAPIAMLTHVPDHIQILAELVVQFRHRQWFTK